MLCAKGLPDKDESSAMRTLRLTGNSLFRGDLANSMRDVINAACKSKAPTYIDRYERDTKLIVTNLLAAAFQWEWLGLGTRIFKDSYLAKMGLSRRRVEHIVRALIQLGYVVKGRGGYLNHANPSKSRSSEYYPSEKLIQLGAKMLYECVGDFDDYEPYEWEGDQRWDVNEARNIKIIRDYNEFMRSHSWAQKAPTVRKLLDTPFTGGRVYTPYQTIVNRRVPIRRNTHLDGEPLVECDFSANHPYMLAKLTGNEFRADFYSVIAEGSKCDKTVVKAVITAAIGCPSLSKAHETRFSLQDKRGIAGRDVEKVITTASDAFPWLKDHNLLFHNKGVYMQWLEGEIAMRMFAYAVKEEIPMINVHDAYAVNERHTNTVWAAMNRYREEVLDEYKLKLAL